MTNLVGPPRDELAAWIEARGLANKVGDDGRPFGHLVVTEWIADPGDEVALTGRVESGLGPYRGKPVLRVTRARLLVAKD
jgi:hypothetical protein